MRTAWALALVIVSLAAHAQDPKADAKLARTFVERWGRGRAVLVDPALADRIAGAIGSFRGNFCYKPNDTPKPRPCDTLLASTETLYRLTAAYLDDALLSGKPEVLTLFQRLALHIDSDGARAGWPPSEKSTRAAKLPLEAAGTSVAIVTARGALTADHLVRTIWMPAGTYEVRTNGKAYRVAFAQDSPPRIERVGDAAGTVDPGRFGIAWELACITETIITVDSEKIEGTGRDLMMQRPAEFVNAGGVSISIDAPAERCNARCRAALKRDVLDALAFWRAGCSRCPVDYLAAAKIEGEIHADERLVHGAPGAGMLFGARPLNLFVPVDAAAVRALRDGSASVAAFLAGGPAPSLRLIVGGRPTKCEGGAEVIACATVGNAIELNAADYTFVEGNLALFGTGEHRVRLLTVLVHELGHWFGLPHVDQLRTPREDRHAIMEAMYAEGQCITRGELTLLDRITDLEFSKRLKSCDGFRFRVSK
jgi:hypothetical protein